jgi:hypothetical protein
VLFNGEKWVKMRCRQLQWEQEADGRRMVYRVEAFEYL